MNYTLKKIVPKEKFYRVYINADSNAEDYISTIEIYDQETFDAVAKELKNLKDNYSKSQQLKDYENIADLSIPCSDWGYCHSLEDLEVTMHDIDGFTYEVIL